MRNAMIGLALVLCMLIGAIVFGGGESQAQRTSTKGSVYGVCYPVASLDDWKGRASKHGDAKGTEKTYMRETHFPFERSNDEAQQRLNMQFAIHKALNKGWQVSGVHGDTILLYHEKPPVTRVSQDE